MQDLDSLGIVAPYAQSRGFVSLKTVDSSMIPSLSVDLFGYCAKMKLNPAQNDAVPWQVMYAMRNRVSHGYDKLDFEMVWKTICNDLPDLHKLVKAVSSEAKG